MNTIQNIGHGNQVKWFVIWVTRPTRAQGILGQYIEHHTKHNSRAHDPSHGMGGWPLARRMLRQARSRCTKQCDSRNAIPCAICVANRCACGCHSGSLILDLHGPIKVLLQDIIIVTVICIMVPLRLLDLGPARPH